jgi:hypothetical protein
MDERLPGWLETNRATANQRRNDVTWAVWLDDIVAFYEQHRRLPPKSTRLGEWLSRQRQIARGQMRYTMDPERRAMLDERLPGWLNPDHTL